MIRTLVVDDEPLARELICSLLKHENDIEIVGECNDGKSALRLIRSAKPSLVYLDVQMPRLTGIGLLRKLRSEWMPYIIFVTAYDKYAVEAFEHQALDYILKPFDKKRFRQSLERARRAIKGKHLADLSDKFVRLADTFAKLGRSATKEFSSDAKTYPTEFVIKEGRRYDCIAVDDIVWIEAANQYVRIHTKSGSFLKSESLTSIEERLDPAEFVRIHRSALISMAHVKAVRAAKNGVNLISLSNGPTLKLPRSRQELLTKLLRNC